MVVARVKNYEIGEELYRTAWGCVAMVRSARGANAGPRVIKLFQPATFEVRDDTEGIETFLRRVQVQKQLADSGSRHWAPVYDFGQVEGGAFFITDLFPRTLQKLAGRITIGAAELYVLIRAVVTGTLELEKALGRGHGALKPTNVLIGGAPSLRKAQIVLCDPAAAMDKCADDDAVALGELIHQLVIGRRFSGPGSWPVPAGPQWKHLGSRGEGWRALCNRLLDPMPSQPRPKLDELALMVDRLRPAQIWIPVLIGGAMVGVLTAGALGVAQWEQRNAAEFESARSRWFGPLAGMLISERAAGKLDTTSDASLIKLIDQIQQNDLVNLQLPSPVFYKPDLAALSRSREAVGLVRSLPSYFDDKSWQRLAMIKQLQTACRDAGLNQPADFLSSFVVQCSTFDERTPTAVRSLVEIPPSLLQDLQRGADISRLIASRLTGSAATGGDPFLDRYAQSLKAQADAAGQNVRVSSGKCVGLEKLGAIEKRVARFAKVVEDARSVGWPGRLDMSAFSNDVEANLLNAPLSDASLHEWSSSISDYISTPVPADLPALAGMRKRLDEAIQRGPVAPSFQTMADDCRRQIDEFAAAQFTRKQISESSRRFVAAMAAPNDSLQKLSEYGQKLDGALRTADQTGQTDPKAGLALADDLLKVDPNFQAAMELRSRLLNVLVNADLVRARAEESNQQLDAAQLDVLAALKLDSQNANALALRDELTKQQADQIQQQVNHAHQLSQQIADLRAEIATSPIEALRGVARLQKSEPNNPSLSTLQQQSEFAAIKAATQLKNAGELSDANEMITELLAVDANQPDAVRLQGEIAAITNRSERINQLLAKAHAEMASAPADALIDANAVLALDKTNADALGLQHAANLKIRAQVDPLVEAQRKIAALRAMVSTSPLEALRGVASLDKSARDDPAALKVQQDAEAATLKTAADLSGSSDSAKLDEASRMTAASLQIDANQPDAIHLRQEIADKISSIHRADTINQLLAKARSEMAGAPTQSLDDANKVLSLDPSNTEAAGLRRDAIAAAVSAGDVYYARNTDADFHNAAAFYGPAADAGDMHAMLKMAWLCDFGKGDKQDSAQAFAWYQKAADAGDMAAKLIVANRYVSGVGVAQDYPAAMKYYRQCADAGSVPAMNDVGDLYRNGQGTPQDFGQALIWYQKAANAGDSSAMLEIALMYGEGGPGLRKDESQAKSWYQKASDAGNPTAKRWVENQKAPVVPAAPPNHHPQVGAN